MKVWSGYLLLYVLLSGYHREFKNWNKNFKNIERVGEKKERKKELKGVSELKKKRKKRLIPDVELIEADCWSGT